LTAHAHENSSPFAADPAVIADARRRQRRRRYALSALSVVAAVLVAAVVVDMRGGGGATSPAGERTADQLPLVGVTVTGFNAPLTLQRVTPRTLSPEGAKLRLAGPGGGNQGLQYATRGNLLAVEVYGIDRQRTPIRIVDMRRLRVVHSVAFARGDICGLTFDGPTLVALIAVPWCNAAPNAPTEFSLARIGFDGTVSRTMTVTGLKPFLYPVALTYGDGHAYVARATGSIESIDLQTGILKSHKPLRTLAKATDAVSAQWLGTHLLGVDARAIDVRTWRTRFLAPDAQKLAPGGQNIVAYGDDGAALYTRTGHLLFRLLRGENIRAAHVVGHYLYVDADTDTEVLDLRTHKRISVVPHANGWTLLAP
jgi:hypothetical protein